MAYPFISFIIPLFNQLVATQAMLNSLQSTLPVDQDYEIILVDDFSTDGTRDWLLTLTQPGITIHLNSTNKGFAHTVNTGVQLAVGDLLCLLNNDLILQPNWLPPMMGILLSPELRAGVVGNLQFRIADGRLDHAGVVLSLKGKLEHIQTLPHQDVVFEKVIAVTGACWVLRKADFVALGGFDEDFVNGGEDIDICLAMRRLGKFCYVANHSRILHHVSLSRKQVALRDEHNSRRLFTKWHPEIKQRLAEQWVAYLHKSDVNLKPYCHGELSSDFLAHPHVAGRIIAEHFLQRDSFYWSRLLDNHDPQHTLADRCKCYGLQYSAERDGYLLNKKSEIAVYHLQSARNFFIYGRRLTKGDERPVVVSILVNGIQQQTQQIGAAQNFSAGLIDPIVLQGITNYFTFCCYVIHPVTGAQLDNVNEAFLLTQCVIDDQVIFDS